MHQDSESDLARDELAAGQDRQEVPSWLELPPDTEVSPPVETRPQVLPLEQLDWDDFERLCLRLVRISGTVEHAQLYGTRGQDQSGIDLYARQEDGVYVVFQCKK